MHTAVHPDPDRPQSERQHSLTSNFLSGLIKSELMLSTILRTDDHFITLHFLLNIAHF